MRAILAVLVVFSAYFYADDSRASALYQFTIGGVNTLFPTFETGARASCTQHYPADNSGWECPESTCPVRNMNGSPVPTIIGGSGQAQCYALQEYPSGVWNPAYQSWVNAGSFQVQSGTCPTGYTDEGGVCVPFNQCTSLDGQTFSAGYYDLGTDPSASPQVTGCDGGCTTDYNGGGVSARQMVNGEYHYFSVGSYVYDGTQCTGGASPSGTVSPPAPSCDPATQDQGTVNGVSVCLDRTDTTEKTKTVETDPETGEITETTTTTNPDGSTTTETTTTNPATGSSSSTTTTERPPADPFCSANPTDPSCQPTDDMCAQRPDTIGCAKLGEYEHGIPTASHVFEFNPETVSMAGSCPAPISVLGQSLSFDTACGAMSTIKPLVVGMAAVMAAFLLFGGMRGAD